MESVPRRDAAVVVAPDIVVVLEKLIVLVVLQDPAGDRPLGVGVGRVEPDRRRVVCRAVRVRVLPKPEQLDQGVDAVGDRPEVVERPVEAGGVLKYFG